MPGATKGNPGTQEPGSNKDLAGMVNGSSESSTPAGVFGGRYVECWKYG